MYNNTNNSYMSSYVEIFKKSLDDFNINYVDGDEKDSVLLNLRLNNMGDLRALAFFKPLNIDTSNSCCMFDLYFQVTPLENPPLSAFELCNAINKEYKIFNVYLDDDSMWCQATIFVNLSNCANLCNFTLLKTVMTIDEYYPQIMKIRWGI